MELHGNKKLTDDNHITFTSLMSFYTNYQLGSTNFERFQQHLQKDWAPTTKEDDAHEESIVSNAPVTLDRMNICECPTRYECNPISARKQWCGFPLQTNINRVILEVQHKSAALPLPHHT
ncbi:hypothetical protein KIN20_001846 [Parelaphostrongylus tenuis]|uniref:Uncharacterized protein n=1 Tax=Parelaphostrongylus tenuis TaxID=148309 RepID=A0AAD5LUS7_PARTN|nr:hypothetical protein KIN20_001846 [Parelaphostrongylus tenuis]